MQPNKKFLNDIVSDIKITTSERKIVDLDIPQYFKLGNKEVKIPLSFLDKSISYIYVTDDNSTKLTRTCWITPTVSSLISSFKNSQDGDCNYSDLDKALDSAYKGLNFFIKEKVLKDRKGPGFMAFVQANENVPKDSIIITQRTLDKFLIPSNSDWKHANSLVVTRFPNLGPNTTCILNLCIYSPLAPLESKVPISGNTNYAMDAVYLHPDVLEGMLQGDGDGDTIYATINDFGNRETTFIDLIRDPGTIEIFEAQKEKLVRKCKRQSTNNLASYMVNYFDSTPIGPATYAIRYKTYKKAKELKEKKVSLNPMFDAWKQISPWAIQIVEFVMDIRKGDFTNQEIDQKLAEITHWTTLISNDRNNGDWFSKSVTSSILIDPHDFLKEFTSLQDYLDYIYPQ